MVQMGNTGKARQQKKKEGKELEPENLNDLRSLTYPFIPLPTYINICIHKVCLLSITDNMIQNIFHVHQQQHGLTSRDTTSVALVLIKTRVYEPCQLSCSSGILDTLHMFSHGHTHKKPNQKQIPTQSISLTRMHKPVKLTLESRCSRFKGFCPTSETSSFPDASDTL